MGKQQVQEVVHSSHGQPLDRYIRKEEDRPSGDTPLASDIPVIDLSRMFQSDGPCTEAEKLLSALQSGGLFHAIGHGMSESFLEEMRDMIKKFFQLPTEMKQKYTKLREDLPVEGYEVDKHKVEDQILNWIDRTILVVQPEDERNLELWPKNPTTFRDNLHEYTLRARKVAEKVLSAAAKVLKLDEDSFIQQLGDRANVMASFNYVPFCSRPDLVLGLQPHADGSFLTINLPDKEVEGLQVLRDSEWVKVPIVPQALVINLGMQMEIVSNGVFKSPVHRVVASKEERVSLVMFYFLEMEKDLEPLDGLVDETRPRMFKKITVKDLNEAYFRSGTSSEGKCNLDWLKV